MPAKSPMHCPTTDPDRTAMRIAPRTLLCATDWRVHADDSGVRFEELRELCALAGDKTSLAIGIMGPIRGMRSAASCVRRSDWRLN